MDPRHQYWIARAIANNMGVGNAALTILYGIQSRYHLRVNNGKHLVLKNSDKKKNGKTHTHINMVDLSSLIMREIKSTSHWSDLVSGEGSRSRCRNVKLVMSEDGFIRNAIATDTHLPSMDHHLGDVDEVTTTATTTITACLVEDANLAELAEVMGDKTGLAHLYRTSTATTTPITNNTLLDYVRPKLAKMDRGRDFVFSPPSKNRLDTILNMVSDPDRRAEVETYLHMHAREYHEDLMTGFMVSLAEEVKTRLKKLLFPSETGFVAARPTTQLLLLECWPLILHSATKCARYVAGSIPCFNDREDEVCQFSLVFRDSGSPEMKALKRTQRRQQREKDRMKQQQTSVDQEDHRSLLGRVSQYASRDVYEFAMFVAMRPSFELSMGCRDRLFVSALPHTEGDVLMPSCCQYLWNGGTNTHMLTDFGKVPFYSGADTSETVTLDNIVSMIQNVAGGDRHDSMCAVSTDADSVVFSAINMTMSARNIQYITNVEKEIEDGWCMGNSNSSNSNNNVGGGGDTLVPCTPEEAERMLCPASIHQSFLVNKLCVATGPMSHAARKNPLPFGEPSSECFDITVWNKTGTSPALILVLELLTGGDYSTPLMHTSETMNRVLQNHLDHQNEWKEKRSELYEMYSSQGINGPYTGRSRMLHADSTVEGGGAKLPFLAAACEFADFDRRVCTCLRGSCQLVANKLSGAIPKSLEMDNVRVENISMCESCGKKSVRPFDELRTFLLFCAIGMDTEYNLLGTFERLVQRWDFSSYSSSADRDLSCRLSINNEVAAAYAMLAFGRTNKVLYGFRQSTSRTGMQYLSKGEDTSSITPEKKCLVLTNPVSMWLHDMYDCHHLDDESRSPAGLRNFDGAARVPEYTANIDATRRRRIRAVTNAGAGRKGGRTKDPTAIFSQLMSQEEDEEDEDYLDYKDAKLYHSLMELTNAEVTQSPVVTKSARVDALLTALNKKSISDDDANDNSTTQNPFDDDFEFDADVLDEIERNAAVAPPTAAEPRDPRELCRETIRQSRETLIEQSPFAALDHFVSHKKINGKNKLAISAPSTLKLLNKVFLTKFGVNFVPSRRSPGGGKKKGDKPHKKSPRSLPHKLSTTTDEEDFMDVGTTTTTNFNGVDVVDAAVDGDATNGNKPILDGMTTFLDLLQCKLYYLTNQDVLVGNQRVPIEHQRRATEISELTNDKTSRKSDNGGGKRKRSTAVGIPDVREPQIPLHPLPQEEVIDNVPNGMTRNTTLRSFSDGLQEIMLVLYSGALNGVAMDARASASTTKMGTDKQQAIKLAMRRVISQMKLRTKQDVAFSSFISCAEQLGLQSLDTSIRSMLDTTLNLPVFGNNTALPALNQWLTMLEMAPLLH